MSIETLVFEKGVPGRRAATMPSMDVPVESLESMIPSHLLREEPAPLPEVSEIEVVRHYTHLSQRNFGVDTGFYPLGSCTMKYNPKINEDMAALPGFAHIHPLQPEETVQGAIELMYELEQYLAEISGMARVTLQPSAGAHGELTGLMLIKAYHQSRGEGQRNLILIPDNAHGTNPASATLADYKSVEIKSDPRTGGIDMDYLQTILDKHGSAVAAIMLTNPNTLGLFDANIAEVGRLIHAVGGQLYYDGANANAVLGITRPGDMGFDVVHFNLHKTCSTPHGGGGPGSWSHRCQGAFSRFLAGSATCEEWARLLLGRSRSAVDRQSACECRQLRCAGTCLYLHSFKWTRWPTSCLRERNSQCQLPQA